MTSTSRASWAAWASFLVGKQSSCSPAALTRQNPSLSDAGAGDEPGVGDGVAATRGATVIAAFDASASSSVGEALQLLAVRVDEACLGDLWHDRQFGQRVLSGLLRRGTPVVLAVGTHEAVPRLGSLLDRRLGETGDLHLDRAARDGDVGLADPERIDPVRDVRAGSLHHLVRRAVGGREGHRDTPFEVEPEDRFQRPGREADQRRERQHQHEDDRCPQAARSPHANSAPFTTRRNRASRCSAATRQSCMRPRKISKYSMTWLMPVSIVSSRLTVRAAESTRRNDCSTA